MKRSVLGWVLLSVVAVALTSSSYGQVAVGISVRFGPPALPVYAQPICPGPGYIWTPGYWAWSDDAGYYWVPGTWVMAPVGMLWTPGYWGWGGGVYLWHPGYWGPHVGFYGGINYGYGYGGVGFVGGEWRRGAFYYNRSVTNVSVTNVTNVYNKTVVVNNTSTVSYNGGTGGIPVRPSRQEEAYARESHMAPLAVQSEHQQAASRERQNFASENHGRPIVAATARPADFSNHSVVAARAAGGEYHAPAMSPREARVNSNAGNRASGNANRPGSNDGFRSFTPPNRGNSTGNAGNDRPGGNANRAGANSNRPASNDGFRPFTPPNRGGAAGNAGNTRPNQNNNRGNENNNRGNQNYNRGNENYNRGNQNSSPGNEGRSNQSRPMNQPRESAPPRVNQRQSQPHSNPPVQHRQAPPKEERRGR